MNSVLRTEAVAEQLMLIGMSAGEAEIMAESGYVMPPEVGNGQHPTDRYYSQIAAAANRTWIDEEAETGGPEPDVTPREVIIDVEIINGRFMIGGVKAVIAATGKSRPRFFEYSTAPKL